MSDDSNEYKRKIHKNLERSYLSFSDDVTQIEYCLYEDHDYALLLIPPDPKWDGSMNTPLVKKLFDGFDKQNISTMRFSFNKYQIFNNNYDKYITQTAVCLEEILKLTETKKRIWLVGYSFGSLVALNLALRRPDVQGIVMISPPLLNYDFLSWFIPFHTNVMIVYGTKDHLLPENVIEQYAKYLSANKMNVNLCHILGADHNLSGKEQQILNECISFIEQCIKKEKQALNHVQ